MYNGVVDFQEAMTRARAAHVNTKTCHQPGNDYRTEYLCRCGQFVFATGWEQHVLDAADRLLVENNERVRED